MDGLLFDAALRQVTTARSRRGALVALLGGGLSVLGITAGDAKHRHKKRKKPRRGTSPLLPPPPPPISCLDPTLPNVCARTRSCLPACAPDKSFDPATCRCLCLDRRQCCECLDAGSVDLCFTFTIPGDAEDCQNVCQAQGLAAYRFVSGGSAECSSNGAVGCNTICSDDS